MPKVDTRKVFSEKKSKIPRPLNSFMIFRTEHQSDVAMKHPSANHQEISKLLAQKWKALDCEEKKMYGNKANAAKEAHKLLYPTYKYCPRRRNVPLKRGKKERKARSSVEGNQPEPIDPVNECLFEFATLYPLQAANVAFDQMISDSMLLHPAMNNENYYYQDPSASPSAFSMMSQFSHLSSEYEPSILQLPGPYQTADANPYYCDPSLYDTYNTGYHQIDQTFNFTDYDTTLTEYFIPHQTRFPENLTPHTVLSHTRHTVLSHTQNTEENIAQTNHFSPSFHTSAAPLLTQSFVYLDF